MSKLTSTPAEQADTVRDVQETVRQVEETFGTPQWSYEGAFSRNLGLITPEEQETLRRSRVAIAGMGGVGGIHLATLARLGIGKFTIADPDTYELANMNRQYGCRVDTLGRSKVEVMAEEARRINPEIEIRSMPEPVTEDNITEFLDGADLFVDGLDFFVIEARRLAFREARRRGIWAITAGPHAFGAAWQVFDPDGMSFDDFYDFRDAMNDQEKIVAFSVGCVPSPLHLAYVDLKRYFRPGEQGAASAALACNIASGILTATSAKILLDREEVRAVPWYGHFDACRQKLVTRKLRGGNRHPWQRMKRWWLRRLMDRQAADAE